MTTFQTSGTAEGEEPLSQSGSSSTAWKYFGFRARNVNREQSTCTEKQHN